MFMLAPSLLSSDAILNFNKIDQLYSSSLVARRRAAEYKTSGRMYYVARVHPAYSNDPCKVSTRLDVSSLLKGGSEMSFFGFGAFSTPVGQLIGELLLNFSLAVPVQTLSV